MTNLFKTAKTVERPTLKKKEKETKVKADKSRPFPVEPRIPHQLPYDPKKAREEKLQYKRDLINEIRRVMNYQNGSFYVGSLMTCKVVNMLNGRYGDDLISDLLEDADLSTLKKVHKELDPYIQHMRKHYVPEEKESIQKVQGSRSLLITIELKKCHDCPHQGHSGGFTPGGAKNICKHPDAAEYATKDKNIRDCEDKHHWKFRVIKNMSSIPAWCPLRHGSKY